MLGKSIKRRDENRGAAVDLRLDSMISWYGWGYASAGNFGVV